MWVHAGGARLHYRDSGTGRPILFLHGGWGYEIYPLDEPALAAGARLVVPDRSGYGRSPRLDRLDTDFHRRAAFETLAVIEALGLDRPIVWGHSDGAVIATLMALAVPGRIAGVVLEATHLGGHKPRSREFFETILRDPDSVGERVAAVLARDHGDDWRQVIARHADAWLRLGREREADADFYDGRLGELRVPALVVHGARDPRTEPGELDKIRAALREAEVHVLAEGGHSPHSERATMEKVTESVERFVRRLTVESEPPTAERESLRSSAIGGGAPTARSSK